MTCDHPKEYVKHFYNKRFDGKYEFIFKCLKCKKVLEILKEEDGNIIKT